MARPSLSRAIVVDILIEASIGREWLLNIGRRNALARLAHLICEIHYRLAISATSLVESDLRSEEHTSELQSLMRISYAVFCLKKKKKKKLKNTTTINKQQQLSN